MAQIERTINQITETMLSKLHSGDCNSRNHINNKIQKNGKAFGRKEESSGKKELLQFISALWLTFFCNHGLFHFSRENILWAFKVL